MNIALELKTEILGYSKDGSTQWHAALTVMSLVYNEIEPAL